MNRHPSALGRIHPLASLGPLASLATLVGVVIASAGPAAAQSDPRHAVDRFEPSVRGSEWFANDSLDLRVAPAATFRPSFGYVFSYARKSVVVGDVAVVKDLALLHLGGSVDILGRFRVALDLPLQPYAGGNSAVADGTTYPAPPKEEGIGDLRASVDLRLFGEHHRAVTGALGVQVWAPTGSRSQWISDGVFRVRPRAMLAGEVGAFVWSSQIGLAVRDRTEATAAGAAGVRLRRTIVVGPELFFSTVLADAFAGRATPVEALFGVHWLAQGTARISAGLGAGLGEGIGAPAWRAVAGVEWAPDLPHQRRPPHPQDDPLNMLAPDRDGDGIPDALDACPDALGVRTQDPSTNGCPPDSDGDGIDDLADACPTVPGLPSPDPALNGCPDRDRDKDGIPNDRDACPDDRGPPDVDPRRNGCPRAIVAGHRIEMFDPIAFQGSEIAAGAENEALLTAVLAAVLKLPETTSLRIEGHTDSRGDAAANKRLGAARAAAVGRWLVEHGVAQDRIASEGVGGDRPVATNETEVGRAENRRIEVHLTP